MSDTYTKLFSSITESTIWSAPYPTRIVWITMLAMANADGEVFAPLPGLARRANVSLEEAEAAIASFQTPDPYSRTKDEDGRRVVEIDGGWRLVSHAKYRAVRDEAERREYKRQWDRNNRPSGHARGSDSPTAVRQQSDKSDTSPTNPTLPTPPTPTPTPSKSKELKLSARQVARADEGRFPEWWAVYPKKVARKPALQKWQGRGLDAIADRLIADVRNRIANDDGWKRGYIPDPTTYLNQDRWNDDLRAAPRERTPAPAAPSKTFSLIQKLEGMKHGLAGNRTSHGPAEVALLGTGTDPRD